MVPCPKGCAPKPRILETRVARRRYECTLCNTRYTTRETIVPDLPETSQTSRVFGKPEMPAQVPIRKEPPLPKTLADLPKGPTARTQARHMLEDRAHDRADDYYATL